MSKPAIFAYNLNKEKYASLQALCGVLKIRLRPVTREEYGLKLAALAGSSDSAFEASEKAVPTEEHFDGEMLLLADFTDGELNGLLSGLRREKVSVPLKAVLTKTNANWDSFELYRQISAEHEFMHRDGSSGTRG